MKVPVCVIIGAGPGNGAAYARVFSRAGYKVALLARGRESLDALAAEIAGAIQNHLTPQGVAVIVQCQHFWMCYRGVRKPGSWTTTSKLHGVFLSDSAAWMELLTLIGMPRNIGASSI